MEKAQGNQRVLGVDALRGMAIILMVVYHFIFDLVTFAAADPVLLFNPQMDLLQLVIAVSFILLAGVSCHFSRSNIKRALRILAAAVVITVVTVNMQLPILFGILHFLGTAMLFYGCTYRFWESLPSSIQPVLYTGLLAGSLILLQQVETQANYLWMLGFPYDSFVSLDYYPMLPWLFVFMLGTWLGRLLREGRFPLWVSTVKPPLLPEIGRRSLTIYLLHQPILYGLIMLYLAVI